MKFYDTIIIVATSILGGFYTGQGIGYILGGFPSIFQQESKYIKI